MKKIIALITTLSFLSCTDNKLSTDTKLMDFGVFTIETPSQWKQIKEASIDSYGGRISIDQQDTVEFDLGLYSDNLYESDPQLIDSLMIPLMDSSYKNNISIIFVKNKKHVDPDTYRHNNVTWEIIDNRKAKLVYPRVTGIGTTGVYMDSLWTYEAEEIKFNMYGMNLKPANQVAVLKAFHSLKFYQNRKSK